MITVGCDLKVEVRVFQGTLPSCLVGRPVFVRIFCSRTVSSLNHHILFVFFPAQSVRSAMGAPQQIVEKPAHYRIKGSFLSWADIYPMVGAVGPSYVRRHIWMINNLYTLLMYLTVTFKPLHCHPFSHLRYLIYYHQSFPPPLVTLDYLSSHHLRRGPHFGHFAFLLAA